MPTRSVLASCLLSSFLCVPFATASDPWLDDVSLLLGTGEREAYLRLGEAERQDFVRRFWEVR
ncbi:MAG: hypothetical protein ACLGI9_16400, partial [Thermoanaerobaculia bacterium]